MAEAAGVLVSDATRSLDREYSFGCMAETVGDRLVKGRWKEDDHRGVLGTVGKGYEGVRSGWLAAGVGGTLPRMVRADSVDSVDVVSVVGMGLGLLKAPSSVGDMRPTGSSSLMGETRRLARAGTVLVVVVVVAAAATAATAVRRRAR